jgi:hypothetical protein
MKEARMTNDSKSTLHGNKTDQDQLTDDQLQAVSGGYDEVAHCISWQFFPAAFEGAAVGGDVHAGGPFGGAVATGDTHSGR